MSKPSICRGYTIAPHSDLPNRYLNEDPPDSYRCSVCGDLAYDEIVDPHALDLECCDKQECIAASIRQLKKYRTAAKQIGEFMASHPHTVEPITLRMQVLALALAGAMQGEL